MSANRIVRTEFAAALAQVASNWNIPTESLLEGIRQGMVSAYRKQFGPLDDSHHYTATVDADTGESQIFKYPVLKRDEETGEVLSFDDKKMENVTPAGFGRIAVQTAKQVILQKIRESEREQLLAEFSERVGEIINAQILRMDGRSVIVDLGRGQGWMPPEEQMRGEFYRLNNRIAVFIKEIRETVKGRQIVVSRAAKDLVTKLFAREVPEVQAGDVEVVTIAREAGVRTKLAVRSKKDGVDPVGACVGQRGVRVQEVIKELNNEKIDIIPFVADQVELLKGALAPAEGLQISIDADTKLATVIAPDDQLSLAIGRGGQNVRLAAKLTGLKITIKSAAGAVASTVTGEEEYEIDTYEHMTPEVRQILIENKFTTVADLSRFKERWLQFPEIGDQLKETLLAKVTAFDQEQAERDALSLGRRQRQAAGETSEKS